MTGRGVVCDYLLSVEAENADIVLAIQNNELVGAELEGSNRGSPWRSKGYADSFLAKDVHNARAELGFVRADSEQRLDGVIRKRRDLRVDAIAGKLSGLLAGGPFQQALGINVHRRP